MTTNRTNVLPYETFAHHTAIADSGIQFVAKVMLFFIAQRYKFEAIRNKDYSVVKTSKAAKIFSRFFVWAGRKKKLGGRRVLGWALTDSNRRPSACKADALNQLS